jgi:ABC-type multidrug transport system ATPase subunit
MTVVLRADGLCVERAGRTILHQVSLQLHRGEITVLMGPNGAGKSTLLAVLSGLLAPDRGALYVEGRVAAALQTPALAARTARANVELALRWWGTAPGERRRAAAAALTALGAAGLADRPASTLSGGEARRVHLARATAVRADVLLLDEPFAGLDTSTRADLLYAAETALRTPDSGVLVVAHDRGEAWALADRVLVLVDGRLIADGPPATVFEEPGSEELAEFVGFSGVVRTADTVMRLRPADVTVDPAGPVAGVVRRRVPREDGLLLDLDVDGGRVQAVDQLPGPAIGATVRLRLGPGRRYAVRSPDARRP